MTLRSSITASKAPQRCRLPRHYAEREAREIAAPACSSSKPVLPCPRQPPFRHVLELAAFLEWHRLCAIDRDQGARQVPVKVFTRFGQFTLTKLKKAGA